MPWTGERLRRARGLSGLTQDGLREALAALAPDRRAPSGTSISDWENGKAKPGTKWSALLDQLFPADADGDQQQHPPEQTQPVDEVDLTHVDDLHLLAEVARRMAARNRQTGHQTPLPRLRWAKNVFPSARHESDNKARPDNEGGTGVTSTGP